ncbi:hypothetical protein MKZ38_006862 [Zalerion maritima]|uniref:Amino acid permease/ SLC12A domain-containing protein n=1 Tax=Zalerion maritima TaxID=339359 RepID=A0AAD5WQ43_9PEZI|nr:hypothetical protein MKZ38_006862 [Zalerion maritima]
MSYLNEKRGPEDPAGSKMPPRNSPHDSMDKEKVPAGPFQVAPGVDIEVASQRDLKRDLSSRHLQFLAIGGTIGTGLFIGTGSALASSGPLSCLIAFAFMGTIVYTVMISLGEMATFVPVTGSFTVYASRFVDPSLGFAMGWLYWFSWAITFAFELTVAGQIIQYWNDSLNIGIWIGVFWVIFTCLNFLPVKFFGESEMYFASIKVVTIVGWLIFGICMNAGVGDEGYIGFKYWKDPGVFAADIYDGPLGKFVGFWGVLITAAFSYQGTELVGVGAGETSNPRKNVPHAIKWTFWGILSMFMATVFFIGILVPYDDPRLGSGSEDASASPLVIAALRAGVSILPDILNAVLLTAVLSAANSNVYSASRIMVALADEGSAPKCVTKTNRWGTPYVAVSIASAVGLLGFINMAAAGAEVFNWFLAIIGVAGLICWGCINLCHMRFMSALKAQGMDRKVEMPYLAPFQPYMAWYGLFFIALVTLTQGFTAFTPEWDVVGFFSSYVSLILFVVLYGVHKAVCLWWMPQHTGVVALNAMDLQTGRLED